MPLPVETLASALPLEQERVRKLIPLYLSIGFAGAPAVVMMERDLQRADMAISSGDAVAMLKAFTMLRAYRA